MNFNYKRRSSLSMILFEEKDLMDIIRETLEKFDDANLSSEPVREAIARTVKKGVEETGGNIDNEQYFSGHTN